MDHAPSFIQMLRRIIGTYPFGDLMNLTSRSIIMLQSRYKPLNLPLRRNLIEVPYPEILLTEYDVSDPDSRFLMQVTAEDYATMNDALYIPVYLERGKYRRLITNIPIYTAQDMIVPVPCIIDTGAPDTLFLGMAAVDALQKQHLLIGDSKMRIVGVKEKRVLNKQSYCASATKRL